MTPKSDTGRGWLPAISIAIRSIIIFIAVLTVPLTIAQELGLSPGQTTSWILAAYGVSGLIGLALALLYRQPLLTTGNLFALIFIGSLGQEFTYAQLIGAFIVAGAGVLLISALGLTRRLTSWLPAPIVFGLLAGAIIPFVSRIFTSLGDAPLLVGGTFLAYIVGHLIPDRRLPPILPALIVSLALAALTGQFGQIPDRPMLPVPEITMPVFSPQAILTISPVLLVLIVLQSNLPSIVFMRDQGFQPPERVVDVVSGLGAIVGSLLGPIGVSLSLPATSLVAGPEAGHPDVRHRSVLLSAAGLLLIGLLAGVAAAVPSVIPAALLTTLAGLAVVGVLLNALQKVTEGPLLLGPMFAFAVSLSNISFLGFGPFFWALIVGTATSLLLEREQVKELNAGAQTQAT